MRKQILFLILFSGALSIVNVEQVYSQTYSCGFEDQVTWGGSNTSNRAANADAKRTGGYGQYATCSNGNGRRVTSPAVNVENGKKYFAICWVKANASCTAGVGIGGAAGTYPFSINKNEWTAIYSSYTAGSNTTKTINPTFTVSENTTFYVDDVVMYETTMSEVDLTKPTSATSPSASLDEISWTNGTDAGTGVQKTLIFHRTGGSVGANDLTLNNQGVYSLTSTEGPSVVGNWTLLSASIAANANKYEGVFTSGHEYAIVHRDMAYNYSTPTYVVATGSARAETTTAISSASISSLNLDLSNGSSAGTLVATVTETVGGTAVEGATVTWTSSDPTVATIVSETGVVTLVGEGSTTITASFAATVTHSASNDTYDMTVTDSRLDPEISYGTSVINKIIGDDEFTNVLTNENSVTITYSISNNGTGATINPSTGLVTLGSNQGSETITATSTANVTYKSVKVTYTLNVGMSAVNNVFWDFSDWTSGSFTTVKAEQNIELVATSDKGMEISTNNSQTIADESFTKRLKLTGTGSSSARYVHFKVKPNTKISVYQYSGNAERKVKVDAGSFNGTNLLTEGNSGYVKMSCIYTGASETDIYLYSSSSNISIYGIKIEPIVPVAITAATWASFSSASALDFTGTDVTAYIAKAKDATHVTLSQINKVPAETGIVVYAESAGTYAIPVLSGDADATTGNLLKPNLSAYELPATEGTDPVYYNYTLAVDGDKNPIFKRSTGVGELAAGKAYLQSSVYAAAPSIFRDVNEENNATNIEDLDANEKVTKFIQNGQFFIMRDGVTYDALGRVVR